MINLGEYIFIDSTCYITKKHDLSDDPQKLFWCTHKTKKIIMTNVTFEDTH